MRLKSLEINGFKSFVDKTAIRFRPGITAVVGPNGCGKSNVVDAMRWVMGEQSPRRLRGKGMDDVIFAGSEGRAAIGMAEVVLTFDNSDGSAPPSFSAFSEIQIARRLYRSGESEYLLNKAPCRLRDVHDFFRDTGIGTKGYTIVEQGRIAEIVSARPEERRVIIEEAAGIGKYKARRREAESKIASTEQNLLRVNDVLTEIRRQISSIERQARKAARYKRLRETSRVLELSLAADDRRELLTSLEESGRELQGLRDEVTALETNLAERELAVQAKRLELTECERVLSHGSENLLTLRTEIKECEGRVEFGRRERESLAELVTARRSELEQLREQRVAQETEFGALADERQSVERAVASGEEALRSAEAAVTQAREARDTVEREREAANAGLVEVLTAIARAEDRLAAVEDRRAELDTRMRTADEVLDVGQTEASRADREQQALEEGLRNLLAERDRMMGLLRTSLESHARAVEREREAGECLRASRESLEGRRARLASLREVVERRDDVGQGTRHLLSRDEGVQRGFGLRGLVRDMLEVDRGVERAVEAALSDRAEAIVVERAEGAVAALESLRAEEAGRGVFVALPSVEAVPSTGIVPLGQPLLERVRPVPGYEDLTRALLSGINLVDDLRDVLRVYPEGRLPAKFVTPAGDLLAPDGVIRGGASGAAGEGGHIARVREVRDLETEVADLERRVTAEETAHSESRSALGAAADELENLRTRHHTAALAVANHEKDLERTRERAKALGEVHEGRVVERSEILAESQSLAAERVRLQKTLEDSRLDRGTRQRALDGLGLRLGTAGRELNRLETLATEQRVEHAGRAERLERLCATHDRAAAALGETQIWIERRNGEIEGAEARREELAGSIEEAGAILETRLRDEESARMGHDEKREAFERVSSEVNGLDEGVRELRAEIGGRRERLSARELLLRESEMKLAHLDESVREKWSVEIATWSPPALDPAPVVPVVAGSEAAEGGDSPGVAARGETGGATATTPVGVQRDGGEEEESAPDAAREARANAELARLPSAERREHLEAVRKKMQGLGEVNLGAIEEHE